MSNTTQLIVFDWDGTLMDSEARIVACLRAAIEETGLPHRPEAALRNIIGLGLREALVTLYPEGTDHQHDALVTHYRHHFLDSNETPSPLFEGAEGLIRELHEQGHFLAVATGKGRQGLDKVLEETALGEYFHYTRCADETRSKPHPQMLLDIMDWVGVEPNETLMVGDTEFDLQMAHNAGAKALGVSYGVHDKARLLACEPLACLDSLAEVAAWLNANVNKAA
ncbi:MAG: HAD-IA family hydrolase [Thiohalomonadales bacterium]|nr:HAD-IA family hydrolase [Thiohalomonadales bacterium]